MNERMGMLKLKLIKASNVEWLMMLQGTNNAYGDVQEEMVRSEGYGGGLSNYNNNSTWPI